MCIKKEFSDNFITKNISDITMEILLNKSKISLQYKVSVFCLNEKKINKIIFHKISYDNIVNLK